MPRPRSRHPAPPGPAPRRGVSSAKKPTALKLPEDEADMPKLSASSMLLKRLGWMVRNLEQYRPIRADPWPRV